MVWGKLILTAGILGGVYYANKKYNLLEHVRGTLTGGNNGYTLEDFYTPHADRNERIGDALNANNRNKLTDDGWKEEVKRYKMLVNELGDKLNKLNRLPKANVIVEGQQLRSEIESIVKLLNEAEDAFGTKELQEASA
jgi:hypothetical protein